jgi:hypothetical protein
MHRPKMIILSLREEFHVYAENDNQELHKPEYMTLSKIPLTNIKTEPIQVNKKPIK